MMKNIAVPISELLARASRARQRSVLRAAPAVTEAALASEMKEFEDLYASSLDTLNRQRAAVPEGDKWEEETAAVDKLIDELASQKQHLLSSMVTLTDVERDRRITELDELDALFDKSYGIQEMTKEERTVRSDDHARHLTRRRSKYLRNRAKEYPPIAEQLSALMKWAKDGDKSAVDAIAARIEEVNLKHPKPE